MSDYIELIEFKRPDESSKKLYLPNLTESAPGKPSVQSQLELAFSDFGLLYDVHVIAATGNDDRTTSHPADNMTSSIDVYAFVTFYARRDAMRAKKALTGRLMVNGKLVTIKFSRPRPQQQSAHALYISKCNELANFYLGFNGWSLSILSLKPLETTETTDSSDPEVAGSNPRIRIHCVVQIKLAVDDLHAEGAAIAERPYTQNDPASKAVAMCRARKQAYQQAAQAAWGRVVLVTFGEGEGEGVGGRGGRRVHVEVNTTLEEQLCFDDELDKKSMLKVRDCSTPPLVDSDEEAAMDDLDNLQILKDLQTSAFEEECEG